MGLFDLFKKSPAPAKTPYQDESVNLAYELLFCDHIDQYKKIIKEPYQYPWDALLSSPENVTELLKVTSDEKAESRVKLLAYNRLRSIGQTVDKKILYGVVVEVGLKNGLDVLASFSDGTARYLNQSGKILIWETPDEQSGELTRKLFSAGKTVLAEIGPWDKPRKPNPDGGDLRITFLVSDGLYFGEGPMDTMFNDPLAGPALLTAAELMTYLTEKVMGRPGQ